MKLKPHYKIIQARRRVDRAKAYFDKVSEEIQRQCPHEIIYEIPYDRGEFISSPARRLCPHCGLEEEEGKLSGWGYDILHNREEDRIIQQVDRRKFFKART